MVNETSRRLGYEVKDANVRVIAWFTVILVSSTLVIYFAVAALYKLWASKYPSPNAASRIELHPAMLAPPPQLQTNPAADLEKFTAAEEARLNSYGWVDHAHNVIHIPIERAMDLVAQRGLPVRGQGTPDSSGKTPEQMRQDKAAATSP